MFIVILDLVSIEPDRVQYFKIDQQGEMTDISKLSRTRLNELLEWYNKKLKNSRSEDMRRAYGYVVEQIHEFTYEGVVSGGPDVFVVCKMMRLTDVRSFIKTYLGRIKTKDEQAEEIIDEHLGSRKNSYHGIELPDDQTVRLFFGYVMKEEPPKLAEAAKLLTEFYGMGNVTVKLLNLPDTTLFYDFDEKQIIINPEKIKERISLLDAILTGFFEHMCNIKSWKFGKDLSESLYVQRQETKKFVLKFAFRCSELGLLPPPKKD